MSKETTYELSFTEEEEKARTHFWECLEKNIPFHYEFSEEYVTNSISKFQKQGWKLVDDIQDEK